MEKELNALRIDKYNSIADSKKRKTMSKSKTEQNKSSKVRNV